MLTLLISAFRQLGTAIDERSELITNYAYIHSVLSYLTVVEKYECISQLLLRSLFLMNIRNKERNSFRKML